MNIVFMSMDTLPSTLWARDLYDQMHIRSDFRKWFPRMCQYGFIEGRDYEYQIKNSLAPRAEDIRFSISADKGFQWLECRPQSFENQKPDRKPEFESEQQKAVYWIKHFLEKGDMSANEIYCRLDNEGVSKRVARMVKTEMGIHCYQKKRKWYWSVQPEEGAMNGSQV